MILSYLNFNANHFGNFVTFIGLSLIISLLFSNLPIMHIFVLFLVYAK